MKFEYLYRYNIESAYTPIRGPSEQLKSYNRRLYTTFLTGIHAAAGFPGMRVQKLWPNIDWLRIWKNLSDAPVSEDTRCIWYHVIHNSNKRSATPYQYDSLGHLPVMYSD